MANKRSIRNRVARKKKELIDVDITSLLDILVILLVFLLRSYSSGITMTVPEGITLPTSQTQNVNNLGVNIQVSATKIWVDDKQILDTSELPDRLYDQNGRRIIPLYNELVQKKNAVEVLAKSAKDAKPFSGIVNLIVDKSIKYNYIKKLLYTSATAGYKQYKFVVMGENQ
jgi:biopolymer transport protein ExbD